MAGRPESLQIDGLEVIVHETADAVARAAYAALEDTLSRHEHPVVSFATGATFGGMFQLIADAVGRKRLSLRGMIGTHLDEYLGFGPDRPGGMVHEIVTRCPPLGRALDEGRFWPVPSSGDRSALDAHRRRLLRHGGVALQFLGIGRNGHIAFNEPGTDFGLGFHRATLAESTRDAARARFAPAEPPTEAVTAGPASILAARRIVLAATGAAKAPAFRRMLEGPIEPACPASVLRRHEAVTVLVDEAAAG